MDDDLVYTAKDLDRSVVAEDQIRTGDPEFLLLLPENSDPVESRHKVRRRRQSD